MTTITAVTTTKTTTKTSSTTTTTATTSRATTTTTAAQVKCGVKKAGTKIVGGVETQVGLILLDSYLKFSHIIMVNFACEGKISN